MDSGRTLLVVDDVPMFRELGALFLARSGKVLTADDGEEALEIVRRERPALVLTDLHMPRMDGIALCAAIKSDPDLAATPVVVMTGSELATDHAHAVLAGADDVIPKPMCRSELPETVNRFVRFPSPRGLPRAPVDASVRIRSAAGERWGRARNVSRGGIFVEADLDLGPRSDVTLDFELPETFRRFSPTARVVWQRRGGESTRPGIGLRFVGIDGKSTRVLAEYVHERAGGSLGLRALEGAG